MPDLPTVHAHPWHDTRHHTATGFRNVHGEPLGVPPLQALRWVLTRPFQRKPNVPAETVPLDGSLANPPTDRLRVTWLGHASLLLQAREATVLIDPMASLRASPLQLLGPKRFVPFPTDLAALPRPNVVLLTHDHYDHLDAASIRVVARAFRPLFLVPLGVGPLARRFGAEHVVELDWYQYVEHDGVRYSAVPARHFSGRSLFNRNGTLWAGWYLETPTVKLYHAADSGYGTHFAEIGERLGRPDVAVVPIGAYEPRWFMGEVHVTPEEAWQAMRDVGARHVIPAHWGTFDLADEPLHEPIERFVRARRAADAALHSLAVGQSVNVP